MNAALDKIIAFFIICIGVYALWTVVRGLKAGKIKHFGIPILRTVQPKRFFIEMAGRFLAGLLFVVMGLFFLI